MSGISLVCFSASYAVAFLLEMSRYLFRSGIRGALMLGFAAAGLLAHTIYLYHRAVTAVGPALSSKHDWYLLAAWVLVVIYLYLIASFPRVAFGLILLPLALALIGASTMADTAPFDRRPAHQVWAMIHGTSILLATVALLVGFAAGVMYLLKARRLKHGQVAAASGPRLPSLEWMERVNARALLLATLAFALGVLSGIVLNLVDHDNHVAWNDPVVVSTLVTFGWLLVAVIVGGFYRPALRGRRVAYLTMVSFVFLTVSLSLGLLVETEHRAERSAGEATAGGAS